MTDVTYYFDELDDLTGGVSGIVYLTTQYPYVTFFGINGSTVRLAQDGSQYNSGVPHDDGSVQQGRDNAWCCAPYNAGGTIFKGDFGFRLDYGMRVSFWIGYTDQPGSTTVTLYKDADMTEIVDVWVPGLGYERYESTVRVRGMKLVQVNEAAGTELDNLTLYGVDPLAPVKRQRQSPKGSPSRVGWR